MKYNKPELVEAGLALDAVQELKGNIASSDYDGFRPTQPAYEIDE